MSIKIKKIGWIEELDKEIYFFVIPYKLDPIYEGLAKHQDKEAYNSDNFTITVMYNCISKEYNVPRTLVYIEKDGTLFEFGDALSKKDIKVAIKFCKKYLKKEVNTMTRSEWLAKEGKVIVDVGCLEEAKVISKDELPLKNVRYIGTDFEALYDGKEVNVDCYEDNEDGSLYGVVSL